MKEQLSSSVEAKGCGSEAYVHWNLSLHIPSFSRHFTRSHRVRWSIFYDGANNAKCTQHHSSHAFLPNILYETSTCSSSKATIVCCTPLARHMRRHKFSLSDTTCGRSEAARYRVRESRRQCFAIAATRRQFCLEARGSTLLSFVVKNVH